MLTIAENLNFCLPTKQWNPEAQAKFTGSLSNTYKELGI